MNASLVQPPQALSRSRTERWSEVTGGVVIDDVVDVTMGTRSWRRLAVNPPTAFTTNGIVAGLPYSATIVGIGLTRYGNVPPDLLQLSETVKSPPRPVCAVVVRMRYHFVCGTTKRIEALMLLSRVADLSSSPVRSS